MEFNKAWAGSSASKDLFAFSLQPLRVLPLVSACLGPEPPKPAQGHAGNLGQGEEYTLGPHPEPPRTRRLHEPRRIKSSHRHTHTSTSMHTRCKRGPSCGAFWLGCFFRRRRLAREINIEANSVRNVCLFFCLYVSLFVFSPRQCWKKNNI